MTSCERVIAAMTFKSPDRIPVDLWLRGLLYERHASEIDALLDRYPVDFAYSKESLLPREGFVPSILGIHEDEWGCVWENTSRGYMGQVKKCPLDDYGKLDSFKNTFYKTTGMDWQQERDAYEFNRDQVIEAFSQATGQSTDSACK